VSEATRLTGQLRREQLQARELSLTIRFENFSEVGGSIASSIAISKLRHQRRAGRHFPRSDVRANQTRRQIHIAFWNLAGSTSSRRSGAAPTPNTGVRSTTPTRIPKAKCPFAPRRESVRKLWGTDAYPLAHKGDWEKRLARVSKQAEFNR